MASVTENEHDDSLEAVREKERHPDDIQEGLPPNEQAALDQIEAGLNDDPSQNVTDSNWQTNLGNSTGKKTLKARVLNRKTAVGGGIIGVVIGGMSIFSFLQGPMRYLNIDFALGKPSRLGGVAADARIFGFSRTARLYRTSDVGETRVGYLGSRSFHNIMNRLEETHGITFERRAETGRPHNVKVEAKEGSPLWDGNDPERFRQNVIRELKLPDPSRVKLIGQTSDGRPIVRALLRGELASELNRVSEAIVRLDNETANRTRGRTYLATRSRLIKKFWNAPSLFNPVHRIATDIDESVRSYVEVERNRRSKAGKKPRLKAKYQQAIAEARGKLGAKGATLAGSALTFTGGLCLLKEMSALLPDLNYAAIQVPAMEEALDKQSVASAVRYGDFDANELGAIDQSLTDQEGRTVESAQSFNASLNGGPGYGAPVDPALRQAFTMRGGNISSLVDELIDGSGDEGLIKAAAAGGDSLAGFACSSVGYGIQLVAGAALTLFAPGGIVLKTASFAQSTAVIAIITNLFGDLVESNVEEKARGICGINKEGATFDAHKLGNCMAYGSRGAYNLSALPAGGVELSESQEKSLATRLLEVELSEFRQRSFFARVFDLREPRSLAVGILSGATKTSLIQGTSGLFTRFVATPISLLKGVASLLSPRALAQSETYDWGFPLVGIPLEIIEDPKYEDPFENQSIVADGILQNDLIKDRARKCFGVQIEQVDGRWQATVVEEVVQADNSYVEARCDEFRYGQDNEDEAWIRTALFVFDDSIALSTDCLDSQGDPNSCNELGFGGIGVQEPLAPINASGLNGYTIPCTGSPREVVRVDSGRTVRADWSNIPSSGSIGNGSDNSPLNVYIREACTSENMKTVLIAASIHGSENGGQLVAHELLFNEQLPPNIRLIVLPEINNFGVNLRSSAGYGGRVNANGVNLNRNFDYRWKLANRGDNHNDSGPSAHSEPEARAIVDFLTSLGKIDLGLHYHDDLGYVAAVGNSTPLHLSQIYASYTPDTPVRNAEGGRVFQSGSLEGWHNDELGVPSLLIELSSNQSNPIINGHVRAVKALMESGL